MRLFKKLICASAALSGIFSAIAQEAVQDDSFLNEFVPHIWNASNGLKGNSVTDIIQTTDGYIQLGTYDGLIRFDGVDFLLVNKNTDPNVSFVSARTLFQDRQDNFWIGANDEGVTCVKNDGTTEKFTTENGLPNNSVRAFCQTIDGTVWVGTSSGIAWIKDGVVTVPEKYDLPNDNKVLVKSFFVDNLQRVWVITADGNGVLVYSSGNFSKFSSLKKINSMQVSSVMQDEKGVFWFGVMPHHVVRYDGESETVYDIGYGAQKGTVVNHITKDSDGNIWCALDSGITVMHDGIMTHISQSNYLSDEKVTKIIEDREGNIWIATDRGGLEKLTHAKFKTIPAGGSVNAIAKDSGRDVVWMGADNGLLCFKAGKFVQNKITDYCKNIRIRHVGTTKAGDLLVSTYEKLGQLKIYPDGKIQSWTKEKDGLTGNKVRVAIEASDGNLYIGTTNGLNIVDQKTGRISKITKDSGIENDYIMCIYEDARGEIWVGTDGGGVFTLKNGEIAKAYSTEDGLAGNVVFKISEIGENQLWFCTGTGISCFTNNEFKNFDASNGLGTDSVFQILPDYAGNYWCTSNNGIFSVKGEDFEAVAAGKKTHLEPKLYGSSDGIISGGVTATSLSMEDEVGTLWFTMIDGVAVYNPFKMSQNSNAPVTHIQRVTVDNVVQPGNLKTVTIHYSEKRLNIRFAGLSFISPERVQYKYKLEGFDKQYSDWSNERSVSYTNLKPGSYKFRFIAKSVDEVESEPSEPLVIVKTAAVYQHIWFWLLVVTAVMILVYVIVKKRIAHLKKDNERLQKIYLEITQALTRTVDAKDKYTNGHSERVAKYSLMIAEKAGLSNDTCKTLYMMAILHDIGKIGVPDSIINKPGKLTDEEFEVIKTHPVIGYDILKSITSIKGIEIGARHHHERYDGGGYPDHLRGEEIPFEARIIGVADAYDAMTSNRSYRKYLDQSVVRDQIEKGKGSQFDPEYADMMLKIIDEDVSYILHE